MKNFTIARLIGLGFAFVVALTSVFGAVSYLKMTELNSLKDKLYRHPYAVSNNIRDVEKSILAMHRSMKDVALAQDAAQITKAMAAVAEWEVKAFGYFDVIAERFLGDQQRVATARQDFTNWKQIRERVVENMRNGDRAAAADITRNEGVAHLGKMGSSLGYLRNFADEKAIEFMENSDRVMQSTVIQMFVILSGVLIFSVGAGFAIYYSFAPKVVQLCGNMRQIADGETDAPIPFTDRTNEVGQIAQALEVFRNNRIAMDRMQVEQAHAKEENEIRRKEAIVSFSTGFLQVVDAAVEGEFGARVTTEFDDPELTDLKEGMNRLMSTTEGALAEITRVLRELADGDLTHRMTGRHQGAFADLAVNINETAQNLSNLIFQITQTSDAVGVATAEILQGSNDLAQRTEDQAAMVEKTSVAMEELSTTVNENAEGANQANILTRQASVSADEGSSVMVDAVAAMQEIESSSSKIAEIVVMIDEIAFQTNLLALNAAVEAARAGEAGKGFAVVATEVRTLAQRSSEASKEIKNLISSSSSQVDEGANLVNQTGASLNQIVEQVKEVSTLISRIAEASTEQANGLAHLASGVSQQDEASQQNAAMVEETTAAVQSLDAQTRELNRLVSVFKIDVNDLGAGNVQSLKLAS